jgi:hypothetical protein
MNTKLEKNPGPESTGAFQELWLNPRRKRLWAVVAVLIYTLTGFFLVPLLVKNGVTSLIQDDLGREVSVEKVEFNPYVLSLRIQGFEMRDRDTVRLAAFDELFINLQVSSLFRWAWTFNEISLTGSYFFFERYDVDDNRLSRILADAAANGHEETVAEESGGLPRLLIHSLLIKNGNGDLKDNVPPTPVETNLGPINVEIQGLNTLPDQHGQQKVTIKLPQDAMLSWQGSLSLTPLESEGDLVLENARIDPSVAYLKSMFPLESLSASLNSRFHYRIHTDEDGQVGFDINDMEIKLDRLAISGLSPETDFLSISEISLNDGTIRYPEKSVRFSSIRIDGPKLATWLDDQGQVNLTQLLPRDAGSSETPSAEDANATPWDFSVGELVLEGGQVSFSDRSFTPGASLGLNELQFSLSEFNNREGEIFPFEFTGGLDEGGRFGLTGKLGYLPQLSLSGTAKTEGISLVPAQPYISQFAQIAVENGSLNSETAITFEGDGQLKAAGKLELHELQVQDTLAKESLLGLGKLDIDNYDLDLHERMLHLSLVALEKPYGRIVINQDRTTNLSGLIISNNAATAKEEGSPEPFTVIVGGVGIQNGSMDFSDLSLPLPFATHIANMNGTISTLATNSTEPASIRLEGQVDEYGLARIDGTINVFDPMLHTDTTVEFRNLLMSNLSPYSIQFAGQEIAEGKLDLDLRYAIEKNQLEGQNDVVLSDLVLGEKVDNPDAASLPLGLAVALLKDSNGVIDIDLPVSGDVNDPEFRIGGVIWQAFAGLITKVVTAPFRLLGSLIGVDSEDLGQFQFLAGRSDLTPPELEKIAQLESALQQRPELSIEIRGVTDSTIDIPALKFIGLRDTVMERLGEESAGKDVENMMLDQEVRNVFESLFSERFPDIPLESLKASHMKAPPGDPEGKPVLDDLAYSAELRDRLLDAEPINEQNLAELAAARAQAVSTAFLASGQFSEDRVVIADAVEVESEDGEWVIMELAVAAE